MFIITFGGHGEKNAITSLRQVLKGVLKLDPLDFGINILLSEDYISGSNNKLITIPCTWKLISYPLLLNKEKLEPMYLIITSKKKYVIAQFN